MLLSAAIGALPILDHQRPPEPGHLVRFSRRLTGMYRCDVCDRVTESGATCNRLVVETRPIEYPHRAEIYWRKPKPGEKGKWDPDPGGHGIATVREVNACDECYAKALALERA